MRRTFPAAVFCVLLGALLAAQQPYWWENPHEDDEFDMYERGKASEAPTEQDAIRNAVRSAKDMLAERIGVGVALAEAGLQPSPEYAIVNFTVAGSGTAREGKKWTAWVLIKYPQAEKKKILERWNASVSSIDELKKIEEKIPAKFDLALQTADVRSRYRDGETISFFVKASADCYLLLFDHQSDGTTVLLFPNRFQTDGFIRKGQTVEIPSDSIASFTLTVGSPYGDDRVEAIASTAKTSFYDSFSGMVAALAPSRDMVFVTRSAFAKSLASALGNDRTDWSRSGLTVSTFGK